MNLPNTITLSRIPLMFVIVWLMRDEGMGNGTATLAFALFVAGAVSDWYDGYLARKMGLISVFGQFMDALSDKIFVLGIMVAMIGLDSVPIWYVLITMGREFLVSGMRMAAASKGVVVPADRGGKTKTLTQLIAIGFLLASQMTRKDVAPWLRIDLGVLTEYLHQIGLVGFAVGTFLAVWSGWRYLERHWKLVFDDVT
jgi:CDP-diacylglycerol--glycerol-3-phosphate 3-phosphatidyltransferase